MGRASRVSQRPSCRSTVQRHPRRSSSSRCADSFGAQGTTGRVSEMKRGGRHRIGTISHFETLGAAARSCSSSVSAGAIGRRYRRQDEIGTPFCVTVDFDTLENGTVTLRDRDTMQQERISVDALIAKVASLVD